VQKVKVLHKIKQHTTTHYNNVSKQFLMHTDLKLSSQKDIHISWNFQLSHKYNLI